MAIVSIIFAALGLGSIGWGVYEDMSEKPQPKPSQQSVPPELMAAYGLLLQNGTDPVAMDTMATTLEGYGYNEMARQLRERAAQLRISRAAGQAPPPPPIPITTKEPVPALLPPSPTKAAELTATLTGTGVNMRSTPNTSGGVVAALNKPEIVVVLNWNAGTANGYTWAQVRNTRGLMGYVARNYLALNGPAPAGVSGQELAFAVGAESHEGIRPGKCVAPSGCRLRKGPNPQAPFTNIVANGDTVMVLKRVEGPKAERMSPGPGGWSLVRYGKTAGWIPSEWLLT